jgi:cephalosporin hydroxylase
MTPIEQFEAERLQRISDLADDAEFRERSRQWLEDSTRRQYVYNFSWMGRPIIQNPVDIVAMQEIIWRVKPDLIIETGIAHGGSLVLSASMLELNAASGGPPDAIVLGIDIDIRAHNRSAIEAHPMARRIEMIEGSSTSAATVQRVVGRTASRKNVLVCLDSNHTHEHVLQELQAYTPLVSVGSYCVVFDTFVEDVPADLFPDRPWGPGNNPKTAVWEFLESHPEFEVDRYLNDKLLISAAPSGYLRRMR